MTVGGRPPTSARRRRLRGPRGPEGPIVLALETGGDHVGVALWRLPEAIGAPAARWRLLDEVTAHRGHRHEVSLLTLVDLALERHELAPADLALVAAGAGPGGFTGVRVGLSTALGLGLATGAPVWPVDSLAASALHGAGRDAVIAPMLDARRGEVYAAAYRVPTYAAPESVLAPMVAPCERCLTALDEAVGHDTARLVFGSGALAYDRASASAPPDWHVAAARHVGALAAFAWEGAGRDAAAAPAVDPRYVRPSDAELARPASG